jgi:uncharacterized protein
MNPVPVQLRGHHFLCMLTYKGLGYSAEFAANMSGKINAIGQGAPVQLVKGPDDICAGMSKACRNATGHDCSAPDIMGMDAVAQQAVEAVLKRDLSIPVPVSSAELDLLRSAFASGSIRAACFGCSWLEVCNQIVAGQFSGTHLLAATP